MLLFYFGFTIQAVLAALAALAALAGPFGNAATYDP